MKYYKKYLGKYVWSYVAILLFANIASICGLLKTYFLSIVVDDVIQLKNINLLRDIVILLVLIAIVEQGISYVVGYMNTHVSQEISYDLRKQIVEKINNTVIGKLQKKQSSDFVVNMTEDVNLVTNMLCNYLVTLLNSIFTVFITVGFILCLNKRLAVISFIIVTTQIIISCLLSKVVKKNQNNILVNNAIHIGIIKQIVNHIKYIRAYRTEVEMSGKYDLCSKKIVDLNYMSYLISYGYSSINTVLGFAGSMIIFILGVLAVYNGEMSIGILFVFDSLTGILSGSITNIVKVVIEYAKGFVSVNRLKELWGSEDESEDGEEMLEDIENIMFTNISFSYDDNVVLDNFSYTFQKGNIYAILGNSGIGKSTLAGLLLKFYKKNTGEILINGRAIEQISTSDVRSKVTMVFQEGVILDGCSVRENIIFNQSVSDEAFYKVAEACKITEFTNKLSEGFDTIIHENGTNFSGGEKQRIYIARALLRKSDVYIFDEAFSGMDKNLEKQIIQYIESELPDKIVIFISHNIESVRKYENIIVFEEDRRISIGNDRELLENSDNYRKFVKGV